MKQLSRGQMKVIILLNFVIVVLLCGLFLIYPLGEIPASGEPDEYEHDIFRNARISLNVNLDFENNIGGSEDEELVASFASGNSIHIFGNTQSEDFDFDDGVGAGMFFVSLNRKAKIERIVRLGDSGEELKKVVLANGGYLLAVENTNSKTTHLLHIGLDGALIKRIEHVATSEEFVADLILMENCYMMVVHSGVSYTNFFDIKVFFYGLDFSTQGVAVLHNLSYSLEYVYVLPKGLDKYIMAANCKSELWNGFALIEFTPSSNSFFRIELENNYTAKGFMPVSGGYAALIIDSGGRACTLKINSADYSLREKKYLSTNAQEASLFFSNGNYYVWIGAKERNLVLKFDSALSVFEEIGLFTDAGRLESTYMQSDGTIFVCSGQDALIAGISSSQSWTKKVGGSNVETSARLVFLGNDIFLVCQSQSNNLDVGANFGKSDIWLAKLSSL